MRNCVRKTYWCILLLVLGLIIIGGASCGKKSSSSGANQFSVELEWTTVADIDLLVEEPTGQVVRGTTNGPTAVSIGDNDCGFGSACIATACTGDLTCDTREQIHAKEIAAGGRYTISVDTNASAVDEKIIVFLTILENWVQAGNPYYMRVECTVPANTATAVQIAYADFPAKGSGTIGAEIAQVTCAVTDQRFR